MHGNHKDSFIHLNEKKRIIIDHKPVFQSSHHTKTEQALVFIGYPFAITINQVSKQTGMTREFPVCFSEPKLV